ncbi:MAG: hypothetical protein WC975_08040 [Phycisphaerae bacterium]
MKKNALTTCVIFIGLFIYGCQNPHAPVQPASGAVVINKAEFDTAWEETIDVLREHYFVPDRQDRRAGLIVSYPALSRQWFEVWRDDVQGTYEKTESSIHSIRRTAQVKFVPVKEKYQIQISILLQRKSQPERQITTASGTILAFRDKAPLVSGQNIPKSEAVTWTQVGEDVKLANYLLHRLERRLPESQWTDHF